MSSIVRLSHALSGQQVAQIRRGVACVAVSGRRAVEDGGLAPQHLDGSSACKFSGFILPGVCLTLSRPLIGFMCARPEDDLVWVAFVNR